MLSSAAVPVILAFAGTSAYSNDVTVGGTNVSSAVVNAAGQVSVATDAGDIAVTIDTAIGSPGAPVVGNGVFAASNKNIGIDISSDITSTGFALYVDSNSVLPTSDVTVNVSSALTSTGVQDTVWILQGTSDVILDGTGGGSIASGRTALFITGYPVLGEPVPEISVANFDSIVGGGTSIWIVSDDGNVSVQNIGQVGDANSAVDGIFVDALSGGAIDIGGSGIIGSIQGGDDGIETYTNGDATTTINVSDVTGGDMGIYSRGESGDISISVSGAVEGTNTNAIDIIGTTGNIAVDGNGAATAKAGVWGIRAETEGGNIDLRKFANVDSGGIAIEARSAGGDISITEIGVAGGINSANDDGIHANGEFADGNLVISGNGAITAGDDGIEAYTHGSGSLSISASSGITANDFGIYARSIDGDMNIEVGADVAVTGKNTTGMDVTAAGSGSTTIDIASGGIVEGAGWGLVTGTDATVNNMGVVRTIDDTGAADNAGLGDALWSWIGTTTFNNDGTILGQIHSDGIGLTLNNGASGAWYAGTDANTFDGTMDVVANSGKIFIREGSTSFVGLEEFHNLGGGIVDLAYGGSATDSLTVYNLASDAGSEFTFDFDASVANGAGTGFDDSDDGMGTADTIVVAGNATPEAGTIVNINSVAGDPAGLTGSVSLIYTGTNLAAPTPGATIMSSDYYVFGSNGLTTGATAYYLVDDGLGGVYLQWAPNLTASSMGAFAGGSLSSGKAGGFAGVLASAAFGGVGGVGGTGGPNGGGAVGVVGDLAAGNAGAGSDASSDSCGMNIWTHSDRTSTNGNGNAGALSVSTTAGVELDLNSMFDTDCGRLVVGAFGGYGWMNGDWNGGSTTGSSYMAGGYFRFSSESGFYASLLGALSQADADISNRIFGSTAQQDSSGLVGVATAGFVLPIGTADHFDFRGFASQGLVDGDGFKDSSGIVVDGTTSRLTTLGISAGYFRDFDEDVRGYVTAGMKQVRVERSVSAFGVEMDGSTNETYGSVSAGLNAKVSDNASFDASVFSEFSRFTQSIGGHVGLSVKF
jgi:hypothetical protein